MDRVQLIINAGKISSRIKFFLQDVVELRNVLLQYVCLSMFVMCVCPLLLSCGCAKHTEARPEPG